MLKIEGWHGTTNIRKNKIFKTGFTYTKYIPGKTEQRHPNDLGNGVYFFLPFHSNSGEHLALAYVKKYKSKLLNQKGISPALISATLTIESGEEIFYLDTPKNQALLAEFKQRFTKEITHELANIVDNNAKKRACYLNKNQGLLIELLLDLANSHGKTFQAVQSETFTNVEGIKCYNGKNGREICIRDLDCITIN